MLKLRTYQQEAVNAVYKHLRARDDNPCVVIPTAGGKTPILATMCKDAVGLWKGRVLILSHVKELLEQSFNHLKEIAPELEIGIYSAGLKSRDTKNSVIVGGIQSIFRRACELDAFDLIIVDEAHLIPEEGEGMYRTFLEEARVVNPNVRVIGLTATPFRMKSGTICSKKNFLNSICYEIGVRELIVQGYLCPLKTKAGKKKADTSNLHMRAGEFIHAETEALMNTDDLVDSACAEIVEQTEGRSSVLIFASGIEHGEHIAEALHPHPAATIFGNTPTTLRKETIRRFKAKELKYLINVNVLTTGFDAPTIDCIAMLRPTMSPGLYYQMVGRGFRVHPEKENCLVLDYGNNILRHGPVDAIRAKNKRSGHGDAPAKECPKCQALIAAGYAICPDCGFVFPEPERGRHDATASTEGILSGRVKLEVHEVLSTRYEIHTKREAPDGAPKTMRVDYQTSWMHVQSEWVCFEHSGFPRQKAESWWRLRSHAPIPDTVLEAVAMAKDGVLAKTTAITVRSEHGKKYDDIVGYDIDEKPKYRLAGEDEDEPREDEDAWMEQAPF